MSEPLQTLEVIVQPDTFNYSKSGPGHLVQGVKNGTTPKNAVAGGHGSFIVQGTPNDAWFYVKPADPDAGFGKRNIRIAFRNQVKHLYSSQRFTEKFARKIFNALLEQRNITITRKDVNQPWEVKETDMATLLLKLTK